MQSSPSFFDRMNAWARHSVTLKLVIIGIMILFLIIPTSMIDSLIQERQYLRDSAQREVASKWGLQQTIGGPVVSVPYSYTSIDSHGKTILSTGYAHFLPEEIDIKGRLQPEERYRGIFIVVLYQSTIEVHGTFKGFDAAALQIPESSLRWEDATFVMGISDMTGVKSSIQVKLDDTSLELGPGTVTNDVFNSGASAVIPGMAVDKEFSFSYTLDLNGSSAMYFRPFGKRTNLQLQGEWSNPSFDGTFLPKNRNISAEGFQAEWEVLQLNRNYPQQGIGSFVSKFNMGAKNHHSYEDNTADGDRFGVRLLLPVDEYKKIYRSTNFALLFIFITFLTFFFIEVLNKRRVHPIQYLLIGAAIILFYVLLLSISEHITFDFAYWISCAIIVGLITTYSWYVLRNTKLTAIVAALLLILYLFFYSLLQLQDYALLVGSLGLLLILATVMYLTRNVDWYNMNRNGERKG